LGWRLGFIAFRLVFTFVTTVSWNIEWLGLWRFELL